MKPLRYGINKVPGSGTIEMYPDSPIRIKLPQRPPISDVLKSPEYDNELNPEIKKDALRKMINTEVPYIEDSNQDLSPEENAILMKELKNPKMEKFKQLDDVRNQIMEKQKVVDDMLDYAIKRHPGIAEDVKNNTMNYYQDYLDMFPEHEKIDQELQDLQNQYMGDKMHDEHFENVLKKMREAK